MNAIPAGIESSLLESGFSATEVAIISRLLQDDALTLREIASRTGKSTGVLDQAMRKLLQKNIVRKEAINNTVKFTVTSLDAVLHWMQDDSRRKSELMTRRTQTFESFIHSFEHQKHRPQIEYFEGLTAMPQAYRKLLEHGKELLCYEPVFCSIEDHPLRDFMVEWFRIRRKRGVFSRVITHDTPLGRRYQSRDIFEYRKSILIPEEDYPFTFEKILCGDSVACFNYTEKRACILTYPELAAMEKTFFEGIWKKHTEEKKPIAAQAPVSGTASPIPASSPTTPVPTPAPIAFRIRAFSGLREFFLSRTSIAAFCGIAVLAAAVTFSLYSYTKKLQFRQMQETVKSIAATGALQLDAKDLDALQVEEDWRKAEWGKVVKTLEAIRKNNNDLTFVYIFRKNKNDPLKMDFVADSHSLNPYANTDDDPNNDVDADRDGRVDPEGHDKLQWPGQPYPDPVEEIFQAFEKPVATEQMYEDDFGNVMSGFAPVKDADGRVAGVIGVDMKATLLEERTSDVFQPILYFIGFFLLFVFIRLAAFNRSLFQELWSTFNMEKVLMTIVACALLSGAVTYGLYRFNMYLSEQRIREKVLSIAATGALQFDAKDLDQLHTEADIRKPEYVKVIEKLNEIREMNLGVKYLYIIRPTDKKNISGVCTLLQ